VHTVPRSNTVWEHEFTGDTGRALFTVHSRIVGLEYGGLDDDLYVLQTDRVTILNRDGKLRLYRRFAFVPEAEAWDPVSQHLFIGHGTTLSIFDSSLNLVGKYDFRVLGGDGRLILRFNPRSGDLYAMRQGLPAVQRFTHTDKGLQFVATYDMSAYGKPMSFDFGNQFMFVSDGFHMKQFSVDGRRTKGSPFDNAVCGSLLKFAHSYSNYSPDRYPLPAWRNLENPGQTLK
jgi:hypothetical protein